MHMQGYYYTTIYTATWFSDFTTTALQTIDDLSKSINDTMHLHSCYLFAKAFDTVLTLVYF